MNKRSLSFASAALAFALAPIAYSLAGPAEAQRSSAETRHTSLQVIKTIPLGGAGEWGYPTIDSKARRLYLPRTHDVQVMNLDTGKLIGTTRNVSAQVNHGVALAPLQNIGFASAGKDNNVAAFNPATLKVTARIPSAVNPNAMIYDPASGHIIVINHQDLTIIDPADVKATPITFPMGGSLEFAAADGRGSVFVSLENTSEIVRIDTRASKIADRWSVAPGAVPSGITYDPRSNRLYITCHSKVNATDKTGVLAVMDASTGQVIATPAIGTGASGVAFDPENGLILAANGKDGTVSVVKETSPDTYQTIATIKTVLGARHVAFDAKSRRFFLEADLSGTNSFANGEKFGVVVIGPVTTSK